MTTFIARQTGINWDWFFRIETINDMDVKVHKKWRVHKSDPQPDWTRTVDYEHWSAISIDGELFKMV